MKIKSKQTSGSVNPDTLSGQIHDWLDADKAENILTVDLRGQSALADYIIIASGRSTRQVASLASKLRDRLKEQGVRDVHVEGASQADWIIVDAGDIIIHLFRPEVREFYGIEEMWSLETPSLLSSADAGGANLHAL